MSKTEWPTETISSGGKARTQRRIARTQRAKANGERTELQSTKRTLQHRPFENLESVMRSGTSAVY